VILLILISFNFNAFPNSQADSLVKLGQLQFKQKKYSPAKATFLKAIKHYNEIGEEIELISVMNSIGLLEEEIKQNDSAMRYYRLGLSHAREIPDSSVAIDVIMNTANLLIKLKKFSEAKSLLNKGIRISGKAGMTDNVIRGKKLMAELLYRQGNYKDAYNNLLLSARYSDSISVIRYKKLMNEMAIRNEQGVKKTKTLENQQSLSRPFSLIQGYGSTCLIVIIAILMVTLFTIYYIRNKNKDNVANLLFESNRHSEQQDTELRLISATKDKFFSIIAQDLRTPFTTILGFADILKEEYGTLEEKEKMLYIRAIHSSSFNIYELLKNLHDWTRLQSGTLESKPAAIDLAETAEQHIQLFTSYAQNKDIHLSIESQGHPLAFADRNMVSAIIRNLLNNAIKFTNKGGEVHLNIQSLDNKIELSMTDTGIGMSEENLKKLFSLDEGFRSKGTADETGTGLGLILCKKFAAMNHGSIRAESAPGKGSRFTVSFPANIPEKTQ